jgi:hypothetical protein
MNRIVIGSAVAVVWCLAVPFAQDQRLPAPKAEPAHNVFVLTGCLEAGTDPTATFKLTDASAIGQAPPGGAAGAVGTSGQKPSYELRPVSGVSEQGMDAKALKAHLGQRVEVIVRPIDSPAAAPASEPVAAPKPTEAAPKRYTVTELKRVIGSCS